MKRSLLFPLALAGILAFGCGGGGGDAKPTAEAPFESAPLSEPAPGPGTFVIDLAEERWIRVLPVHTSELWFVTTSPDGEIVVYEDDGGLVALDIEDGTRRRVLSAPDSPTALMAAFSPDDGLLAVWATARGRGLTLLRWPEGAPVTDLPGPIGPVAWVGDTLVVGADRTSRARTGWASPSRDLSIRMTPPRAAPCSPLRPERSRNLCSICPGGRPGPSPGHRTARSSR